MLLWLIFHPDGTFEDDASKEALSSDITNFCTNIGLSAFYVVANFIKMPGNTVWVGGKKPNKDKPFIRISIDHASVTMPNLDEVYKRTTDGVDATLKSHIADKGYEWEFHIDETEKRLWKINGLTPPAFKNEEEKIWARENKAVPWQK